ncbi:zinc finger CCCH domain-containing protein 11A [Colossoma macropomum]|uniref:zinc finger CCCH domain-containing protein 11A n=1 Tax=Colossoma macropomum TaxID=42526 RepID=UPI001864443E|nr:zinc finger CCCH domain-containing protein 11A [Colossoma macropomum]
MSMTNKGDDCYFYYYSTCTKGDSCPFRHCEAAMGSEIMCSLWQENRCFRSVCKFRHMEIKKNRKEIPCYWETQPGGCQKPHCAFHHEKPRVIDGLYVPPDKGPAVRKEKDEETPQEDHVLSATAPISNPTNPQLRGVIKSETQESVPSPTHPPVVINPVDDEDDEDDQVSEEGDEASSVSPRKLMNSSKDDSLNFGINTLEEIRLRKALKANLKRAGHPSSNGAGTEKENIQSLTQLASLATKSESSVLEDPGKRKVTDRLGKRLNRDIPVEGDLCLKASLAERLGGFVGSPQNNPDMPPQKAVKPVHERLGTAPDLTAPKSPNTEPKPSGEIRIKTLEEIRKEKATKSQLQRKGVRVVMEVPVKSSTKKGNRPVSGPQVKTFSELLHEKKKLQEDKGVSQQGSSSPERTEGLENAVAVKVAAQSGEVRVKTLDEIRKEKAARMQAQAQAQDTSSDNTVSSNDVAVKRRILRISKNTSAASTIPLKKSQDSEKKVDHVAESANGKSDPSSQGVTVKSFEEIMREKKLRKQQENQALSTSQPDQPGQKSTPALSEEKPPVVIRSRITGPAAAPLSTEFSDQAKPSVRQRLGIKPQPSPPVPVVIPEKMSPEAQAEENSLIPNPKKLKLSPTVAPHRQAAEVAVSPGSNSQEPQMEKNQEAPKTSPSKVMETKVRPKLNVKPSVMKPAAQVKLGQKRKTAGSHCSAVAAVKPLNAIPAPEIQPPCKHIESTATVCSSEVGAGTQQMSSLVEDGINLPSKTMSPVTETLSVPQSPVVKTPTLSRARRQSLVSARAATNPGSSSMVDDFEDLLDEFTDDKLEDEMELDPGKGEDDLLLELSEMIDG